jgi:NTE family protein
MLRPSYSRSDRIGDLYDRYFYKAAWEKPLGKRSFGREDQIELRKLMIEPAGTSGFQLDRDNDRRAKVPALLINETSLNSGHNWRFEAIRMGEPLPEDKEHVRIIGQVDKSMRLKQGYFDPEPGSREAPVPDAQVDFPLGLAVAASAAVPGVFQPLAITGMYEGIRVQLVDGGVQDNQGIQGLFDRGCRQLIVSDASGQLDDEEKPKPQLLAVLKRSSGIGQNRIRTEQLIDAETIEDYDYALMHLRKGLPEKAVVPGHSRAEAIEAGRGSAETAAFRVDPDVQAALSNIRTDLDYFGRTEAHSLELDGYRMSKHELSSAGFDRLCDGEQLGEWAFEEVGAKIGSADQAYLAEVQAGRKSFLRLLALRPAAAIVYGVLALTLFAVIAGGALYLALGALEDPSWWAVVLVVVGVALVLVEPLLFIFSNLAVWKTKLLYPS